MKLIDLLVQELPKRGGWPVGYKFVVQDCDRDVKFGINPLVQHEYDGVWRKKSGSEYSTVWSVEETKSNYDSGFFNIGHLSDDYENSIVTIQQYEAALAASQQPAWNVEGLPPVGCECEYTMNGGETWWKCTINYIVGNSGLVMGCDCPGGEQYIHFESYNRKKQQLKFRPIRTEAERKRDEIIKQLFQSLAVNYSASPGQVRQLYEDIAAGKIKGIKLDGDA